MERGRGQPTGGNIRVSFADPTAVDARERARRLETIDANQTAGGNMRTERQVAGKSVFLTEEGATMFDESVGRGEAPEVRDDRLRPLGSGELDFEYHRGNT